MDITQAAFGLDMQSASRIYFLHPVLNPQVEAQAIGRARRISQTKPVTVETLVLRGSVEEVVVRRRGEMTRAEQWKCRSILDDRPIWEWVVNARILPLPGGGDLGGGGALRGEEQMARLEVPLLLFGRGFGRGVGHPDQDLVGGVGAGEGAAQQHERGLVERGRKRREVTGEAAAPEVGELGSGEEGAADAAPTKRARVRFAESGDEGGD
jgi:hypothetical protein